MRFMMVVGLRWLICAGFVVSVSACGQAGDLYMPTEQQTEKKKKVLLDRASDRPLVSFERDDRQPSARTAYRALPPAHESGGEHAG